MTGGDAPRWPAPAARLVSAAAALAASLQHSPGLEGQSSGTWFAQQRSDDAGQETEQDDRQALRRCAHSLRGVGLQFGAAVFAGLCAQVEQTQDAALAARMRSAYAELVQGLEDRLRGR